MYQARFDTEAVVRLSDNMIIGPENLTEWAEYQTWISKGNKPLDPEPLPVYVPPTPEEKLTAAGLTVSELKHLLGL